MDITLTTSDILLEARRIVAYTADKAPSSDGRYDDILAHSEDADLNYIHLQEGCHKVIDTLARYAVAYDIDTDGEIYFEVIEPSNGLPIVNETLFTNLFSTALQEYVAASWLSVASESEAQKHYDAADNALVNALNILNKRKRPEITAVDYNDQY